MLYESMESLSPTNFPISPMASSPSANIPNSSDGDSILELISPVGDMGVGEGEGGQVGCPLDPTPPRRNRSDSLSGSMVTPKTLVPEP